MEADLQKDLEAQLERLAQLPPEERIAVLEELEARLRAELDADDEG
jgi:uncharacterized small protein (DUF1192 family)